MSECLIFNDASLPFPSTSNPGDYLKDFFKILKKADDAQVPLQQTDDVDGSWGSLLYSENFAFGDWINNQLDRDERRFIANTMSKVPCPFVPEVEVFLEERIFVLQEDDSITTEALGFASSIGAPSLSFPSYDHWQKDKLSIIEMKESESGDSTQYFEVNNISNLAQAEPILKEISLRRQENIEFLKGLAASENDDFPNLLFSKEALKTMRRPAEISRYQDQIVSVLRKLNREIPNSTSLAELCENTELDISGESIATMSRKKFARKRIFTHPKLGSTHFEIHVKNFKDAKRLYIFTDYRTKKICVGYFGSHLPNVSDPT